MSSGGNCSSKGKFFTAADTVVDLTSVKAADLKRKTRNGNLQRNKTKTGKSRISLKLLQRFIRMQKPLLKRTRCNKRMLLWDSQPHRSVVLRQRREMEPNWRVIVRLPEMRLSKQTRWYKERMWGRPTKLLLATARRKLLLSLLQHTSKTKDLIQGNPYSYGMRKKGTRTLRMVPKRKRAREDSNLVMGRLFAHKYFQLHSNFNDIENHTLSSLSGSGLIPTGGISHFPILSLKMDVTYSMTLINTGGIRENNRRDLVINYCKTLDTEFSILQETYVNSSHLHDIREL